MIIRSSLLVAIGAAAGAATALLLRSLIEQHRSTLVMSPLATKGAQTTATKGATEPSADTNKSLRIPAFRLREFATAVLVSCNVEPVDATKAAAILILADERGIDSHGIARLKAYFNLLRSGDLNPRPVVRVVSETASTATVDGDNGLGLIVGPKANAIAMQKAKQAGSGWVAVKNTHHYGIAGAYSLAALEQDMIGISMTNSSAVVAPLWGKQRMLGTNPISIAFPADFERPLVVDLATSVVPWGKVEECARMGKPLQPGWAIGPAGEEASVPEDVLGRGALKTLGGDRAHGGHKGYCLSAMVDILCAVLSGGNWGPTVDGFTTHEVNYGGVNGGEAAVGPKDDETPSVGIGHFFGALRIDGFRDVSAFKRTMDLWIATFRGCEPIDPSQPVAVPGDPEWAAMDERISQGVPVKLSVLADIRDVSRASGVPSPFDESLVDLSRATRVIVDL